MSKRSQESSSPGSPMVKAKARCPVSRQRVSVRQDYSSNPESLGITRDSHVWPWEGRNEKSGWYSVQHTSGNREYISGDSGSLAETKTNSDTMKASRKYRSTLRKMHISIWTRFMPSSMQAALHMDPSYEKTSELFKNSEFENIKGLFGITRIDD